jgi:hypothetical protein
VWEDSDRRSDRYLVTGTIAPTQTEVYVTHCTALWERGKHTRDRGQDSGTGVKIQGPESRFRNWGEDSGTGGGGERAAHLRLTGPSDPKARSRTCARDSR